MIAHSIFAESGIVLDIANNGGNATSFNANNWSCFPKEDERLFLSPMGRLFIQNIHDMVNQKQFKPFLKVMNILAIVFIGFGAQFAFQIPSNKDPIVLSKLIDNELSESFLCVPYLSEIPYYVSCLFHRFLQRTSEIIFNCYDMEQHRAYELPGWGHLYGFKKLESIFKNEEQTMYRLSLLFRLCRNMKRLVVFSHILKPDQYEDSITMNGPFLEEILKCMDILDETANDTFTELVIVKPADSIDDFMEQHDGILRQRGWSMVQKSYTHPERVATVDKALYVQRIEQ